MAIRQRLERWLSSAAESLKPKPGPVDRSAEINFLTGQLADSRNREAQYRADYVERCMELIEAKQMAGSGPWLPYEHREAVAAGGKINLQESNPLISQGAYGDIELALQNVEWRREINLSWLEFSRWGIQQIILISRLYYIKNPLIRRLIDIAATYVFGRGFEVTSPDENANEVLKDFFEANRGTLGQIALVELEKRKYYDGNLFFCFFADTGDSGSVAVRTIDATEIMDIVTDPNDSDTPWYYRRVWAERVFDQSNGQVKTQSKEQWYPALNYKPDGEKLKEINGIKVNWDTPILHRKCGNVSKWLFGCPMIYPALDWAKAARKFLEACATVKQGLAQVAATLTTKGGQQAMQGAKAQLQTTVGPQSALWDTNPTATNASIFASGPGTTLAAFQARGASDDPEEVRQYKLMCCMVVGVPETFLADVSTGNLATATTLDRPTELAFKEKQEAWRDDLVTISKYVLEVSKSASGGKLRERLKERASNVVIMEAKRIIGKDGRWRYEAAKPSNDKMEVLVTFPEIREGDQPQMVHAIVEGMTLDNKGGQIVGMDEKVGVGLLYKAFGVENAEEILEEQYPEGEYDADRTKEILAPPIPKLQPGPGGAPQLQAGQPQPKPQQAKTQEALLDLIKALRKRRIA